MNVSTLPVASLTIGGRVFTDLKNLIVLHTGLATTNTYSTARLPNGTSGYQVPASKTLRILAVKCSIVKTVDSGTNIGLGYSDNDAGIDVAVGLLTNPVHCGGAITVPVLASGKETAYSVANVEAPLNFTVPTGKYLFGRHASQGMTFFGYLE